MNSGEDQQPGNELAENGEFDLLAQIGLWEVSSRPTRIRVPRISRLLANRLRLEQGQQWKI